MSFSRFAQPTLWLPHSDLSNNYLSDVPLLFAYPTTTVFLNNNRITSLDPGIFSNISSLLQM